MGSGENQETNDTLKIPEEFSNSKTFFLPDFQLSNRVRSLGKQKDQFAPEAELTEEDFFELENDEHQGGARYIVRSEPIDVGGSAYVFKAFDQELGRVVAVKALKHNQLPGETSLGIQTSEYSDSLQREAKLVANMDHPSIPKVHQLQYGKVPNPRTGESETTVIYIMQFIEGRNLKDLVRENYRMQLRDLKNITLQLSEVLSYLKERGVEHLDIKPGNLIYDFDTERLVLTDFGSASRVTRRPAPGTSGYVSPERLYGTGSYYSDPEYPHKEASEVYSIASTIYELFTNERAIPYDSDELKVYKYCRDNPGLREDQKQIFEIALRTRGLPEENSKRIVGLVDRSLSFDPSKRPSTIQEFAQDFAQGISA